MNSQLAATGIETEAAGKDFSSAYTVYSRIADNMQQVVKGKEATIRILLAAFFSGGHVLLEDVPGTGKTTIAKTLARSVDTAFGRVQFTPDMLPSDILGVSIYRQHSGLFEYIKGPIFANILLADEINRASPRTQSALLEAMEEEQVTMEGRKYDLPELFFVIATQNPVESHGTYPLPESQLDRFMVELSPGYLDRDTEREVLADQLTSHPLTAIEPVTSQEEVRNAGRAMRHIRLSTEMQYYIVDIVGATRQAEGVLLGASVRASLALLRMSQALALFRQREFVTPDDIIEAAPFVLGHRLELSSQARYSGLTSRGVVHTLLEQVPTPR